MEFVAFGHNPWLVATSFLVALVAGGTGLTLTKDLSSQSLGQRKLSIALAAVALGGGIWSMHFVAMLGLQMPILFFYDAAITLLSALIAILMVALALTLLHFRARTNASIAAAGVIVGLGILVMHYVGMAGMQMCRAIYTPFGVVSSAALAVGLCVLAFGVAYRARKARNIALGAMCFGVAVFAVHFLAMAGTRFVALPASSEIGPLISNEVLAIGVILSSFVIFGAFIWVGTTYLIPEQSSPGAPSSGPIPGSVSEVAADRVVPLPRHAPPRIPCEREGVKISLLPTDVLCLRADGHYCQVYTESDRFFCVWPITEATKRLVPAGFLKVHRSYLVNPSKVAQFEREKDKGLCRFAPASAPVVPVSRSHLKQTADALG